MIIYSALTKVLERIMAGDPTTVLWLEPRLGVESSHQTPPYYGSLLLIY